MLEVGHNTKKKPAALSGNQRKAVTIPGADLFLREWEQAKVQTEIAKVGPRESYFDCAPRGASSSADARKKGASILKRDRAKKRA